MASTPASGSEKEQSAESTLQPPSLAPAAAPNSPANYGLSIPAAANVFVGSVVDNVEGLLRLANADAKKVRSRNSGQPGAEFVPVKMLPECHKLVYDRAPEVSVRPSMSKTKHSDTPRPPSRKSSRTSVRTAAEMPSLMTAPSRSSSNVSTAHSTLPDFDDTSAGGSPPPRSFSTSLVSPRKTPSMKAFPSSTSMRTARSPSAKSSGYPTAISPSGRTAISPSGRTAVSVSSRTARSPVAQSSGYPTAISPSGKTAVSPSERTARSPIEKSSGYPTAISPSGRTAISPSERNARSPVTKSSGYPTAISPKTGEEPSEKSGRYQQEKFTNAMAPKPLENVAKTPSRTGAVSPHKSPVFSGTLRSPGMKRSVLASKKSSALFQRSSGYPTARSPSPMTAIEVTENDMQEFQGGRPGAVVRKPSFTDREFTAPRTSEIFDSRNPTRLTRKSSLGSNEMATKERTSVGPQVHPNADGSYEMTVICATEVPGEKVRIRFNLESLVNADPGMADKKYSLTPDELVINKVMVWKK
ncbi:hypothetical protein L596_009540 [Steinernema carpocapsae]|uniref:Uncharacterized protein n=1 Tax=Steinernema carpocapsae TaxID=34508 RepID=A0A4U5PFX9_STECR|nr:hypothetical protein L596_009540 [Steinernema carpocapsae]